MPTFQRLRTAQNRLAELTESGFRVVNELGRWGGGEGQISLRGKHDPVAITSFVEAEQSGPQSPAQERGDGSRSSERWRKHCRSLFLLVWRGCHRKQIGMAVKRVIALDWG